MNSPRDPSAVLVVAENGRAGARMVTALESRGHEVLGCASASSALGHLCGETVRAAVVVVRLGREASIDFVRRAHRIDPLLGAVVVVAGLPRGPESPDGTSGGDPPGRSL